MSVRDKIRAAVLGAKPKVRREQVFGLDIDIRTPPIGVVMSEEFNRKTAVATMLIRYCYVPDTDEPVFDEADVEALLAIPFNPEIAALVKVINDMTDVQTAVNTEGKDSGASPGAEESSNLP